MIAIPIGFFLMLVTPRRRRIVMINLSHCCPTLSRTRVTLETLKVFVNFVFGLIEAVLVWFAPKCAIRTLIKIEISRTDLREIQEWGGLLICPHYSFLEMVAPAIEVAVGPFFVSYRQHESKVINRLLVRGRSRFAGLVDVRDIRKLVGAMSKGHSLWFGPDQDMGLKGSVFATFFGRPVSTVTTPARLCNITGRSAFFVSASRRFLSYELAIQRMPDGYPYTDAVQSAQAVNDLIEKIVSKDLSQYMWTHRRFKTLPNLPRYYIYQ